jgi:hypothetical protein
MYNSFKISWSLLFNHPGSRGQTAPDPGSASLLYVPQRGRGLRFQPVLRIHDILVWIRIRGSKRLTNGFGFGSGSLYFHHWQQKNKLNKKRFFYISHIKNSFSSVFLLSFAHMKPLCYQRSKTKRQMKQKTWRITGVHETIIENH